MKRSVFSQNDSHFSELMVALSYCWKNQNFFVAVQEHDLFLYLGVQLGLMVTTPVSWGKGPYSSVFFHLLKSGTAPKEYAAIPIAARMFANHSACKCPFLGWHTRNFVYFPMLQGSKNTLWHFNKCLTNHSKVVFLVDMWRPNWDVI